MIDLVLDNEGRARLALTALDAFCVPSYGARFTKTLVQEGDPGIPIADLLANIMHLCEQRGWDFEFFLARARDHFDEELFEENQS